MVLSGKQRHVRLVPVRALDGDEVEWIKVAETKGCITLTTGKMRKDPNIYCLCVAIKKQVKHSVTIIISKNCDNVYSWFFFIVLECFASNNIRNNADKSAT